MSELNRISVEQFKEAQKTPLVVVLDNVRSQNNIGSVFRTADAFRVAKICLCGICSTPPHRDIHKTALGAENSVDWQYFEDSAQCVAELKSQGYLVYAVEQVDESIMLDHFQLPANHPPVAVIFGNEVEGVGETLIPMCDGCLEIPQYGTKHSLNISIAAGITIWQLFLQLQADANQ